MTLHIDWKQWCAIVAAIGAGLYGMQRIVSALIALTGAIRSLVTEVRILWGEHEMMASDLAVRRNISRHNLREMAYSLAGLGRKRSSNNGKAKSAPASTSAN